MAHLFQSSLFVDEAREAFRFSFKLPTLAKMSFTATRKLHE